MIECGADPQQVANQTGLELSAIQWHIENCLTMADDDSPDTLEKSDQRIRDLAARIALAGTAASLQGDVKSQLIALSAALRAEQEIRKSLEARLASEPQSGAEAPMSISALDAIVRNYLIATAQEPLCRYCGRPKEPRTEEKAIVAN